MKTLAVLSGVVIGAGVTVWLFGLLVLALSFRDLVVS